jgi:hypothetical protein
MSCANETSLSVREWAGAESETIGVDCNLTHRQQLGTTTKQLRYQLLDWETILTDPNDTFALDRLRGLYAYGMEVAYGILFHDLFQFCMRPVFDVDPISDVSLVLELPRVATNASSILQCIESLVVPFQDEVASIATSRCIIYSRPNGIPSSLRDLEAGTRTIPDFTTSRVCILMNCRQQTRSTQLCDRF